jgi:hypothetical protein
MTSLRDYQSLLSMRRIEARRKNASAFRLRFFQSLASLRHRLSQAKVHRERGLMGTFGPVTVRVPRARLEAPDGKTADWKNATIPAYQRRTKRAGRTRQRARSAILASRDRKRRHESNREYFLGGQAGDGEWARHDLSLWYPGWTVLVVAARGLDPVEQDLGLSHG